jgi:hypothetical protein
LPARTPRRSFATPFIVTIAACSSSGNDPAPPPRPAIVADARRPIDATLSKPAPMDACDPTRPPNITGDAWSLVDTGTHCEATKTVCAGVPCPSPQIKKNMPERTWCGTEDKPLLVTPFNPGKCIEVVLPCQAGTYNPPPPFPCVE